MLTIDNLGVSHSGKVVLREVSFSLRPGKITVLLGKNGAGKSTLFRCINGLQPHTGQILLNGTPLAHLPPVMRARQIGILPQILPSTGFTVRALVSLGRNPYLGTAGRLSAADRSAVENAMTLAQVQPYGDRTVDTLSGGEKQRAYLAMVLAQDTPLLLLDEPTSYLDTDTRRHLLKLLRELADVHGKTLFVILHDLTEAVELADDAVILADGTSVFCGSVRECLRQDALEKWFGVERFFCTNGDMNRIFFR